MGLNPMHVTIEAEIPATYENDSTMQMFLLMDRTIREFRLRGDEDQTDVKKALDMINTVWRTK